METKRARFASLLDLPENVRERIFDFAYPKTQSLHLITRETWNLRECYRLMEHRKDEGCPFPPYKVNEFLISKKYFVAAAKAWIGNQIFDDLHFVQEAKYIGRRQTRGGILFAFAKNFRIPSKHLICLQRFPCMEDQLIDVDDDAFACLKPKLAWKEHFTETDLSKLRFFYGLLNQGRTLQKVTLHATPCLDSVNEDEDQIWKDNIQALESLVQQRLATNNVRRRRMDSISKRMGRPRRMPSHSRPTGEPEPLYEGSRVYHTLSAVAIPPPASDQVLEPAGTTFSLPPPMRQLQYPSDSPVSTEDIENLEKGRQDSVLQSCPAMVEQRNRVEEANHRKASSDQTSEKSNFGISSSKGYMNFYEQAKSEPCTPQVQLTTPDGSPEMPFYSLTSSGLQASIAKVPMAVPQCNDSLAVPRVVHRKSKKQRSTDESMAKVVEMTNQMQEELLRAIELNAAYLNHAFLKDADEADIEAWEKGRKEGFNFNERSQSTLTGPHHAKAASTVDQATQTSPSIDARDHSGITVLVDVAPTMDDYQTSDQPLQTPISEEPDDSEATALLFAMNSSWSDMNAPSPDLLSTSGMIAMLALVWYLTHAAPLTAI